MIMNATDVKNSFGKMIKMLEYEDIIVKKNGRAVAKIIPYSEPLDTLGVIKETSAAYSTVDKKVTYEEFLKFSANTEGRYELLNGQIYFLASPKVTHQMVAGAIHAELLTFFKGKSCTPFISPFDITLEVDGIKNVVQPDIGVICDMDTGRTEKDTYMGIPTLVIEIISKSSRSKDNIKKLYTYSLSGIGEYWIIDPINEMAYVHAFKDYEEVHYASFKQGEVIESFCFEGLKVPW